MCGRQTDGGADIPQAAGDCEEVTERVWLPPRDLNPDMLIQSQPTDADSTQLQQDSSADCGKVLQNPPTRAPNKTVTYEMPRKE